MNCTSTRAQAVFAGLPPAAGSCSPSFPKRPKIHKAMMLLASLSILAGATVRMPVLVPVFGEAGDAWSVLARAVLNE